jgi:hypothetical protein
MMRQPVRSYKGASRGPGASVGVHATLGWNPFGCTEGIRAFLAARTSATRHVNLSDEFTIRTRALFGVFRSANIEGLGDAIASLPDFRGLVLFLAENGIVESLITVSDLTIYPVAMDEELYRKDGPPARSGGPTPGADYVAHENFPKHIVTYLAKCIMAEPLDGLPRLSAQDLPTLFRAGMSCAIRGADGSDYKALRRLETPPEGELPETTTVYVTTRGWGMASVSVSLGDLVKGVPA